MKTIKYILLTILFFASAVLFSEQKFHYDLILTGDPILEDIRFLSLELNTPFLSFSPPLAPAEVKDFLAHVDESLLSVPARLAYFRIMERLSPVSRITYKDERFSLLLDIYAGLEAAARTNTNISWYPRYSQVPNLISIPLRASFVSSIQLFLETSFGMDYDEYYKNHSGINIPAGHEQFSHNFSLRGFAAAGGDWWNFQIGRDRLYWGTGHTGSLTFSDHSPYFDFARLSIFSSTVKYSVMINQFPLTLTEKLFEGSGPDGWDDPANLQKTLQRYFYLHRLDFKVKDRLSIAIMEGMMAGNSTLDLRYLNPLIIYHDLLEWEEFSRWAPGRGDMIGSFASIEVNWNIIKNLSVYGQFVMNELTFSFEPNAHPNGLGYMAGIQYAHPFDVWASVFFFEFIYTDPYLHILSSPFASFIQMDKLEQYYFIGYPRDTIALSVGSKFFYHDKLRLSGVLS
jgi:hypothetical protein